ncbi:MAG: tRNA (adenosine(37)-N6)-threonylcarbamoyltransferase complex ATPase subunit type 1 TsaE [Sphingomonadaceae bacterium]
MKIYLPDMEAMTDFGSRIAENLAAGDVIALSGELGAGKSTLARTIIRSLGYKADVPSPSFTIIETYDPPDIRIPVVHADFYRLDSAQELMEIGLDEYRSGAVLLAEWPENVGGFTYDANCLSIVLEIAGNGREAIVEGQKNWLKRLP